MQRTNFSRATVSVDFAPNAQGWQHWVRPNKRQQNTGRSAGHEPSHIEQLVTRMTEPFVINLVMQLGDILDGIACIFVEMEETFEVLAFGIFHRSWFPGCIVTTRT
ncbi:hypothetical protein MASSI9I_60093 [Massilia sp. 9I]|nr:hypothetical protein MASSI9I_60093 [Massilia sp. 9I]